MMTLVRLAKNQNLRTKDDEGRQSKKNSQGYGAQIERGEACQNPYHEASGENDLKNKK